MLFFGLLSCRTRLCVSQAPNARKVSFMAVYDVFTPECLNDLFPYSSGPMYFYFDASFGSASRTGREGTYLSSITVPFRSFGYRPYRERERTVRVGTVTYVFNFLRYLTEPPTRRARTAVSCAYRRTVPYRPVRTVPLTGSVRPTTYPTT